MWELLEYSLHNAESSGEVILILGWLVVCACLLKMNCDAFQVVHSCNVYLLTLRGAFESSFRIVTSTTQALDLAQYSVLTSLAEPGHCYTAGYLPESSCSAWSEWHFSQSATSSPVSQFLFLLFPRWLTSCPPDRIHGSSPLESARTLPPTMNLAFTSASKFMNVCNYHHYMLN